MNLFNKPGEVITHEWKNFGYNKSYVLEQLRYHPVCSQSKYIFWLDADEVFITDRNNPLSYLSIEQSNQLYNYLEQQSENIFMFKTIFGNLEYDRWQIARNNQKYRWDYPVHEIFIGEESNEYHNSSFFYNLSRKEGNSSRNPDRYLNDIKMFNEFLIDHPNDTRALFYLAQSYQNIYNDKAIETYKKRLEFDGYIEEKYISCLRLGRLLNNIDEKQKYWLEARQYSNERIETIYELMMYYYNKGDMKKGFDIGLLASSNRKNNNYLFCEHEIYNYLFDLHFSVCAYYSGEYNLAYKYGKTLIEQKSYPAYLESQITKNLDFYKTKVVINNDVNIHSIPLNDPLPSIIVIDNFYENPDEIRQFALKQEYPVKGNYPGGRTKSFATDNDKSKFESIVGRKINYFPEGYNGSFQLVTNKNTSWIHRDLTDFSVVIFLTPNPPSNGGTVLYRHKDTSLQRTSNKEQDQILNSDSVNFDKWEIIDRIGNLYNRAIIFQGMISHMSDAYFGEDMETGRLFQTFFFDVEGRKF